jgi:hypothetical protein
MKPLATAILVDVADDEAHACMDASRPIICFARTIAPLKSGSERDDQHEHEAFVSHGSAAFGRKTSFG